MLNKKGLATLVILLAGITFIYAQVYDESHPCKKGYDGLKRDIRQKKIDSLFEPNIINGHYDGWSSSFLKAEGRPPKKPTTENCFDDPDCFEPYLIEYDNWSCMYCAKKAWDGNTKTAWVEGDSGDGIGEIVIAMIDTKKPAEIWGGYGKSERLFYANNRPRSVKVYTLVSTRGFAPQVGTAYADIKVLASIEVELKDFNGYQPLPLPQYQPGQNSGRTFVAVEILSVYRGTKYRDTCITEIRNRP
jgi:hypothetical protein